MNLTELHKRVLTAVILLPIVVFMILFNQSLFNLLLILILLISLYEWYNFNKEKISIATMSGYLIIFLAISFAYFLRGHDDESKIVFLWIVFVCFFSDIGGFCFGKIIGGKKITKISRNKTYAGMYGSFIFSVFPFFILYFIIYKFSEFNTLTLSWKYIILSLLFSLVCQLGDITVSYYKRQNNVKDTGIILPGHGGLLDRIDGLIFVIILSGILKFFNVI